MVTSARPRLRRDAEPLKITSVISPPRRLLALCSPRTQRTASTMLLLPEPLGPTMPLMPAGKSNAVLSANDLKPTSSRRLSMDAYQKRYLLFVICYSLLVASATASPLGASPQRTNNE